MTPERIAILRSEIPVYGRLSTQDSIAVLDALEATQQRLADTCKRLDDANESNDRWEKSLATALRERNEALEQTTNAIHPDFGWIWRDKEVGGQLRLRAEKAERDLSNTRKIIEKYGDHLSWCRARWGNPQSCNCGFNATEATLSLILTSPDQKEQHETHLNHNALCSADSCLFCPCSLFHRNGRRSTTRA